LALLTLLNAINFINRYLLSAVLAQLRVDPNFAGRTDADLGLLQTCFLAVVVVTSPPLGFLAVRTQRKLLVAGGVLVSSAATIWTGLSHGYFELMGSRMLVALGQAAFVVVAPSILSDLFSPDRRARILSVYYASAYAGSALGFIIGGMVAGAHGWRMAFYVGGAPGLLLGLVMLLFADPPRGGTSGTMPESPKSKDRASPLETTRRLLSNRRFLFNCIGQALLYFTLSGLAFWAPTCFVDVHHLDVASAGLRFGGLTVIAGIIGTALGGVLGDRWNRRDPAGYVKLAGSALVVGMPFLLLGVFSHSLNVALALFAVGETFAFLNAGPVNAALLGAVAVEDREVAFGLSAVFCQLFGDALSPWLLGLAADRLVAAGETLARARVLSIAVAALPLLIGGLVLLYSARYYRRAAAT
jgi:MFS family permease